ncbi:hypothetical protein R1flu_012882 [Riccia fluitans]|uniref:Pentatricopeptide repeat-containing protein n=1 Tax=Riccia fluitans TaxID=41844 RepID=A0ABD1ZC10_9MARC
MRSAFCSALVRFVEHDLVTRPGLWYGPGFGRTWSSLGLGTAQGGGEEVSGSRILHLGSFRHCVEIEEKPEVSTSKPAEDYVDSQAGRNAVQAVLQVISRYLGNQNQSGVGRSLSKEVHEIIHREKSAPSVYVYNRLISVLMEAGHHDEAYSVYGDMLPHTARPDSHTYVRLIVGFCKAGRIKQAQQVFRDMRVQRCESKGIVYNAMIHGLGEAGEVSEAWELLNQMTDNNCLPDVWTYNSVIHSLGKSGRVNDSLVLFKTMTSKGCTPDVFTYNSLICALGKAGRVVEACELYEGMIERGCLPDVVTYNTLIPVLCKAGEFASAITLFKFMRSVGCQPDVVTYSSLVAGLCKARRIDDALLLSTEMTLSGCAPNTVTFNSWLDGLCKVGRVAEAHMLFQKMVSLGYVPDAITFSILIDAFCKSGQFVDESFKLLKDIVKRAETLDARTVTIVYQSFKKVGKLKQAKRIMRNARGGGNDRSNLQLASSKDKRLVTPTTCAHKRIVLNPLAIRQEKQSNRRKNIFKGRQILDGIYTVSIEDLHKETIEIKNQIEGVVIISVVKRPNKYDRRS